MNEQSSKQQRVHRLLMASLISCSVAVNACGDLGADETETQSTLDQSCVYIWSSANTRYVSAELAYPNERYGELRARATSVGAWERFQVEDLYGIPFAKDHCDSGTFALKSLANNLYVSAELAYPGSSYAMLRARATTWGAWEAFCMDGDALVAAESAEMVTPELGYSGDSYGMLRARTNGPAGAWEHWFMGRCP